MRLSVVRFDELEPRTAYSLWRLRQQVFILEQASPYPDLDGRDLEPSARHFLIHDGDTLVGCLRLLDDHDAMRIGRVVVAPEARGQGLADQMMRAALTAIGERPARLDAQIGLARWYSTFGFEVCGPGFVEDGVEHVPMARG